MLSNWNTSKSIQINLWVFKLGSEQKRFYKMYEIEIHSEIGHAICVEDSKKYFIQLNNWHLKWNHQRCLKSFAIFGTLYSASI